MVKLPKGIAPGGFVLRFFAHGIGEFTGQEGA
jgi:hypothetical protein